MRNWILTILITLTIAMFINPAFSQKKIIPRISAGSSNIRATVLHVDKLTFPNARITLRITNSTNPRILNTKSRTVSIQARNYLRTTAGRIDIKDKRNIGSIAAYYLLQGDEISAKLYTGYVWGSAWYIYDIDRIAPEKSFFRGGIKVEEGLQLTLRTNQTSFSDDSSVNMTLSVVNTGNTARILKFPTGQRYDFIIRHDGREIWRWSGGRLFTQMLSQMRLNPGDKLEYTEVWRQVNNQRQHVSPGEYEITGVLMTTDPNRPTAGPITISIRQ